VLEHFKKVFKKIGKPRLKKVLSTIEKVPNINAVRKSQGITQPNS